MELKMSAQVSKTQPKFNFANFFKGVQDAPWYPLFLRPALDELQSLPAGSKVLDVGTGPGKFIDLALNRWSHAYVGVDIDHAMLDQARQRPTLAHVPLLKIEPEQPFPFDEGTFDAVCFCSVLFNLEDPQPLLHEALRLLRPGGKVIVLSPTGRGSLKKELRMLSKINFSIHNWTFFLWRNMTRFRAQQWLKKAIPPQVAQKTGLDYKQRFGFEDFAVVEIIQK